MKKGKGVWRTPARRFRWCVWCVSSSRWKFDVNPPALPWGMLGPDPTPREVNSARARLGLAPLDTAAFAGWRQRYEQTRALAPITYAEYASASPSPS